MKILATINAGRAGALLWVCAFGFGCSSAEFRHQSGAGGDEGGSLSSGGDGDSGGGNSGGGKLNGGGVPSGGSSVGAGMGGQSAGTGGVTGMTCDPTILDAAGCSCLVVGKVRDCYLGDAGPKSPCRLGGQQICTEMETGSVFSLCARATAPQATDACFDDVDNDCDGTVDQDCLCSDSLDLCLDEDGKPRAPGTYAMTEPVMPKLGAEFDLIVVSSSALQNIRTDLTGSFCAGGSGVTACGAGAGCAGWSALRQHVKASNPPFAAAGQYTMKIFVNEPGDLPCSSEVDLSLPFTIVP